MATKQIKSNVQSSFSKEDQYLIDILIERQIITQDVMNEIIDQFKHSKKSKNFEQNLIDEKHVKEEIILEIKAALWKIPFVSLKNQEIDIDLLKIIPRDVAVEFCLFPLMQLKDKLFVAMADPKNVEMIDRIRGLTGLQVSPTLASSDEIKQTILKYYEESKSDALLTSEDDFQEILEIIEEDQQNTEESIPINELTRLTNEAPVVRMTNMILRQAIIEEASDIHIIPEENQFSVKMRIDGILKKSYTLPKYIQNGIISRIKVLANLDIAESRIPQDGRMCVRLKDGRQFDIRVSTFPINYGEDMVLRVLRNDMSLLNIDNLGFENDVLERIIEFFSNPYGIILVTGPTGSGKTTTLYAALNHFKNEEKNIITLEDPIEYNMSHVRQSQINEKAGMTFTKGLRSILRHDPDIILVGEIRDPETAQIAIQAALTGHLVLSTLHTNDAVGAVVRMIDIGIDPFLLSSAMIGVIAQRLVRKICLNCQEEYKPMMKIPNDFLESIFSEEEIRNIKFMRGRGCKKCNFTGYEGRIALCEVLPIGKEIQRLIVNMDPSEKIQEIAISHGMRPLLHDGWIKILKGITTLEEVKRVTSIR